MCCEHATCSREICMPQPVITDPNSRLNNSCLDEHIGLKKVLLKGLHASAYAMGNMCEVGV